MMRLCKAVAVVLVTMALALTVLSATAAPKSSTGTVTLQDTDLHFGDTAVVDYHLEHRWREMKGGLGCTQGPGGYDLLLETFWLDPHAFDGTFSFVLANGQGNKSNGELDYSQPATCRTWVFREYWGKQRSMILTNVLRFEVTP